MIYAMFCYENGSFYLSLLIMEELGIIISFLCSSKWHEIFMVYCSYHE